MGNDYQTAETIQKIRSRQTMPELDAMRQETITAMMAGGRETFHLVQREFQKAKDRLG